MVSKSGTIFNEAKYKRIHKDRRKLYVVLQPWNQSKCTIRVEQDADLVLKNLKLQIFGQPQDDVLITTDRRFKHYKANEDCIILKDGLPFRKYYGETDGVKYYQIVIPRQLAEEVLRSLHGEFRKHPGITKTIMAYREKYFYPKMAQIIRNWVMSCEQ